MLVPGKTCCQGKKKIDKTAALLCTSFFFLSFFGHRFLSRHALLHTPDMILSHSSPHSNRQTGRKGESTLVGALVNWLRAADWLVKRFCGFVEAHFALVYVAFTFRWTSSQRGQCPVCFGADILMRELSQLVSWCFEHRELHQGSQCNILRL